MDMADIPIREESPTSTTGLEAIPPASPGSDAQNATESAPEEAETKSIGPKLSYQGFSIYGRTLCLVVKRRGSGGALAGRQASSQQMMEAWVLTQATQATQGDPEE
jgi:hypothetical protein